MGLAHDNDYIGAMSLQRLRPGSEAMIFAALFGATLAYVLAWPQFLGLSDESHFLYRSTEILAGKVPYRDFFEFYTPLSFYLMALALTLLGVKLASAKIFMALLHALTVGLVFKAGSRAGARRPLAVAGAILYLVLGPSAWPYASPHWIAACLMVALFFVLMSHRRETISLVWLGLLTGLLTLTQQQFGVPIALGIGLALMTESLLEASEAQPTSIGKVARRLCLFGLPAIGLTLFVLVWVMLSSGPSPIFDQLVVHPLTGYRSNIQSSWGAVGPLSRWLSAYTFPIVLRFLAPSLLAISIIRVVFAARANERRHLATLSVRTIYLFFSICAVLYYPDFIHLAFISSVVLVVGVETLEWALAKLETMDSLRHLGSVIAVSLAGLAIAQLWNNLEDLNDRFHLQRETEFGRVDFDSETRVRQLRMVRNELAKSPDRALFCYPVYGSLYLLAGGVNPTKHILMLPKYLEHSAFEEVFTTLDENRVRNIVLIPDFLDLATDPMYAYVQRNYECVNAGGSCWLYRRIDPENEVHLPDSASNRNLP